MAEACQTLKRPVLKAYDDAQKRFVLYQPRCKMWKCAPCAHVNKRLWQAKIGYGYEVYSAQGIDDWRFVTITARGYHKTCEECLLAWKQSWPKLSSRMRRAFKHMKYVLLPEHHKDGRVHWHMIASGGMTTRWIKNNAYTTGLGYIGEAKPVRDSWQAIHYVSKYITKTIGSEQWPHNLRRIRTSQNWPVLPPANEMPNHDELNWEYWLSYSSDGLGYLAYELEKTTGIRCDIL